MMRTRLARCLVGAALCGGLGLTWAPPAHVGAVTVPSASDNTIVCNVASTLDIRNTTGGYVWVLSGGGLCVEPPRGPSVVTITGVGTSSDLGACTPSGTLDNLSITVVITLVNVTGGAPKVLVEKFEAAVSSFPVATPFTVTNAGNPVGAGNIDTHIFAHCPPGGTPAAIISWAQSI